MVPVKNHFAGRPPYLLRAKSVLWILMTSN